MMSLVLQHLESLQLNLMAIDPAHRMDAADKVAAMASELRRAVIEEPRGEKRSGAHTAWASETGLRPQH